MIYAGDSILDLLVIVFDAVRDVGYIPDCFLVGMRVPLYKDKDT